LLVVGVAVLAQLPAKLSMQAALEELRRLARIAPQRAVMAVVVAAVAALGALLALVRMVVLTTQELRALPETVAVTLVGWAAGSFCFQEAVDRVGWVALEERLLQLAPTA
jgi:hypothetical protein